MDATKQRRVALYARVSTEEQALQGYSIDAQKECIYAECKLHNKVVVDEYVDAGISGKSITKRPELQRLLKDLDTGKFDEVMVWRLNRLSRNTRDFLEIYETLVKHDIAFVSLTENFDTSGPMGKFTLQMMAAVSELERNTIVENVNLGLTQRARMGLHNGGRALGYGMVPNPMHKGKNDMVIIEREAIIVRKIFNMYCEGKGFYQIAEHLNNEGYKTIRGNTFSLQCVREIIDNPIYKGYVRYARYQKWAERRRKGKNPNPILVKGVHEPIVSEEVWNMAANIRKSSETKNGHSAVKASANILTSLLRCPQCGAAMTVGWSQTKLKSGEKRRYRYYCCSVSKTKGSAVCGINSVRAEEAEKYVIDKITEFLSNPKMVQDVFDKITNKSIVEETKISDRLAEIEARLTDLDKRKSNLLDLYIDGKYDREKLDQRMDEINSNMEYLVKQKDALINESYIANTGINLEYVDKILSNFQDVMNLTPCEQKHLLLKTLIEKITVKNNKVDKIHMRFGKELQEYLNAKAPQNPGELFLCHKAFLRDRNWEVKFVI